MPLQKTDRRDAIVTYTIVCALWAFEEIKNLAIHRRIQDVK